MVIAVRRPAPTFLVYTPLVAKCDTRAERCLDDLGALTDWSRHAAVPRFPVALLL